MQTFNVSFLYYFLKRCPSLKKSRNKVEILCSEPLEHEMGRVPSITLITTEWKQCESLPGAESSLLLLPTL